MSNMQIWDSVSKTNPANTKQVNQRGGFTSICAQSQIMEATRQFGPVGIGWGYIAGQPLFQGRLVFVPVTLWHGDRANTYGPVYGGAEWESAKGHVDSDALKKATTDAVTKLLSQLGFNADVFLGLFDDNKYVEQRRKESEPAPEFISQAQHDELMMLMTHLDVPVKGFLDVAKIGNLKELPASWFERAKKWTNDKAKEARENA